ncbi:MAG TPA: hypothetical protein VL332_05775 [Candidatus Saccharimonadaceae bacterium]|jgi:hypothetical protein|nr:hypothetical protein [Candidatus Saccharimonadaceae bacterium]
MDSAHVQSPRPAGTWPRVAILLGLWLALALLLGASGRLATLRPPAPQELVLSLTVATLVACRMVPWLQAWALSVDPRWLLVLHLSRFVGIVFLRLSASGALSPAFAVPAGWGDLVVVLGAVALLLAGRPQGAARRVAYVAWNVIGLIDIVGVVLTAARVGMADPGGVAPLLHLPLSLLLTYFVPLIIATHVLLFVRLGRWPAASGA